MDRTFNMGVGMVAVVAPDDAERAVAMLRDRHHIAAWQAGEVVTGSGAVRLTGQHPA